MDNDAGLAKTSFIDTSSLHELIRSKVVEEDYLLINYTIFNPSDENDMTNIIFTIGLYEKHNHSELVFTGFNSAQAKLCVDEIIQSIQHGFVQGGTKRYFLSIDKTFDMSVIDRDIYSDLIPPLDHYYKHKAIDVAWMAMIDNSTTDIRIGYEIDNSDNDHLLLHGKTLCYMN